MKELVASLTPEERTVIHASAIALGHARVKLTDRRLLILFVIVIAVGAWLLQNQASHFDSFKRDQKATNDRQRANCEQTQFAFTLVNHYFDGQIAIIQRRVDLSPAVKASLVGNLARSELKPLDCS